jgi:alcohol dehydrogenase
LGGVGLNALLASLASGAGKVVVVDVNEKKLKIARQLGAHETINSTQNNCTEKILDLTDGGVHYAFETAGVPPALDLAYQITKRGGMTVVAGMPGPDAKITLSHLSIPAEERVIKGSYMGSCVPTRDIPRYIELYKNDSLPVDKLIGERFSFDGLNEALDRLDDGEALRQILIF